MPRAAVLANYDLLFAISCCDFDLKAHIWSESIVWWNMNTNFICLLVQTNCIIGAIFLVVSDWIITSFSFKEVSEHDYSLGFIGVPVYVENTIDVGNQMKLIF